MVHVVYIADLALTVGDSIREVKSGCLVVAHLGHDGANVGHADPLLTVVLVELAVDVIGIRVAEHGVREGLLVLTALVLHRETREVHRAGHSIEG